MLNTTATLDCSRIFNTTATLDCSGMLNTAATLNVPCSQQQLAFLWHSFRVIIT